jgi:hypothetical protein
MLLEIIPTNDCPAKVVIWALLNVVDTFRFVVSDLGIRNNFLALTEFTFYLELGETVFGLPMCWLQFQVGASQRALKLLLRNVACFVV